MRVRRIFAVVFGVLGFLVGVALIVGAVWLLNEDRDDDDFYASEPYRFERSSHAIVSGDFDLLTEMPSWFADLVADPVDLRVEGVGASGESLFIGIAPTAEVDRYLSGVAHDEVKGLDLDGRSITNVDYAAREGTVAPTAPGSEGFWEVSTEGVGPQTLEWPLESGSWSAVVMNADGSAGVNADLAFGARISNIVAIAWSVIAFGVFSVFGGGYLVYRGLRRRRISEPTTDVVDMREQAPIEPTRDVAGLPTLEPVGAARHGSEPLQA